MLRRTSRSGSGSSTHPALGRAPGLDYLRAVSTGPLSPMILAFTMVGDVINVGMAYRTTVFRRDAVEGIAAAMLQSIRTL